MASSDLATLLYPPQSTPVLDGLPNLFSRAWYLVFSVISSNFTALQKQINAAVATIPLKMASATQSQLSALGPTLSIGQLVNVTDYGHVLQWSGSAYGWGPGEPGSGMMQLFEVDPTGVGWHLYDGSTVNYLKADGTTGSVTLPDLVSAGANAAYPKAGSPDGGPNAAVAPTLTNGTIASAATGVTASTGSASATVNVLASSVTSVATGAHNHSVSITDPTHTHTISGGSVGTNGEPRNLVRRPWFRM
jgi:hypothetical protein